jgi:hypothetical protein
MFMFRLPLEIEEPPADSTGHRHGRSEPRREPHSAPRGELNPASPFELIGGSHVHSIIPRRSASSIGDEGLLVARVEERTSDDFDSVVHNRSEGGPFVRHQHSSHLIPSEGAAVDDQQWDFSA